MIKNISALKSTNGTLKADTPKVENKNTWRDKDPKTVQNSPQIPV